MKITEVEQLIDAYGSDLYRFCMKITGLKTDAEDLYQQTFLRILEIEKEIDWGNNPKAFIFSISNGLWKNELRKRSRRDFILPCTAIDEDNENFIAAATDVQKDVFTKIQCEEVQKAIYSLDKKFYILVILFYSFDLSIEEIAKIEKIPAGTVKSRLFKAKKLLKKRLEVQGYV